VRLADHSSRGVLSTVLCLSVIVKPRRWPTKGAATPQKKKRNRPANDYAASVEKHGSTRRKNMHHCHSVYHKFHTSWPRIDRGPPRREAGAYSLVIGENIYFSGRVYPPLYEKVISQVST
jgi:hypothetical protein